MLEASKAAARILVQDLHRAKPFYAQKPGLEPSEERPGGLLYHCGNGEFALFESAGAASGDHTQMAWEVEDIEATVERLRACGVVFEEYDILGPEDGQRDRPGPRELPEQGGAGEKAAWFRDSEGNLLGMGQPLS